MKRSNQGYSIVEVLAVVALVGIITAVSLPAFARSLKLARVRSSSNTVISQLRLASTLAETTAQEHEVVFEGDTVSIRNAASGNYVAGRRQMPVARGIEIDASRVEGVIRFRPNGQATDGQIEIVGDVDAVHHEGKVTTVVEVYSSGLVKHENKD